MAGCEVTAFEVPHNPATSPTGLRLSVNGITIGYSGDSGWSPALVEIADTADLFICGVWSLATHDPSFIDLATLERERSKLNWSEIDEPVHAEMLAWYRSLIETRRSCAALTDGRMKEVRVRFDESAQWFTVRRGEIETVCNLAPHPQTVPITLRLAHAMCSAGSRHVRDDAVELPGESVAIFIESSAKG